MSLLYECIHGIIQGGVLKSVEGTREGDDIAKLCITKLRGMLVVEGDPNRKVFFRTEKPILIVCSKIRCASRSQPIGGVSSISGLPARRCDFGLCR